jgi:hypothetical protein
LSPCGLAPVAVPSDHVCPDGRPLLRWQRARVLPRKPLPAPARPRCAPDSRLDTRCPKPHTAPGRGDRSQRRDQRPHRPAAASRTRSAREHCDGAQFRPGATPSVGRASSTRYRAPGGRSQPPSAPTPRSSQATTARPAPSNSLTRSSDSRRRTAATTRSASGGSPQSPTPARCWPVSTMRPTPSPTSTDAAPSPLSITASVSATKSRTSRSCSATSPGRGRRCGLA